MFWLKNVETVSLQSAIQVEAYFLLLQVIEQKIAVKVPDQVLEKTCINIDRRLGLLYRIELYHPAQIHLVAVRDAKN